MLRDNVPAAAKLAQLARSGWPSAYGRERLASEVETRFRAGGPSVEDIHVWLDHVDEYLLAQPGDHYAPIAGASQRLAAVKAEIATQSLSAPERQTVELAEAAIEGRITALRQSKFVKKDVEQQAGEVGQRVTALEHDIETLRKDWVKTDDPREWFAFVQRQLFTTTSDRLKQRWKLWSAAQAARLDRYGRDHESFVAARTATEAVRTALLQLDAAFPPVPLGLSEPFAAAAWERRERDLMSLSRWSEPPTADAATPATPIPDAAGIAKSAHDAGVEFLAWGDKLRALGKDFPIDRELITLDDRPDESWRQRDPEFWASAAVQTLVRVDVSRLGNLQAVVEATRDQLVRLASESRSPEIALAAWTRLGSSSDVRPVWPTQAGELDTELAIRTRLINLLKTLKRPVEASAAIERVIRAGPQRWRRFIEGGNAELLPSAARLRREFGVDEAEVERLTPVGHFNFFLYLAHVASTTGKEDVARAASDNLKISAGRLKALPEMADLVAKLDRVGEPEPVSDPRLLDQSPGEPYKLPVKDSVYLIEFIRVVTPGLRPFYLSTTEVSIGLFSEVTSGANAWPAMNGLLKPPAGLALRGPLAWALGGRPDQPLARFDTWRFDDGRGTPSPFDLAPPLRQTRFNRHSLAERFGDNPNDEHPMQQVPAQAALYAAGLLNCRLPSSREWRAAYDLFEARTPDSDWNLRDQTFRTQLTYRPDVAPNQWPDNGVAGAFWPKDRLRPGQPNCRDSIDNTLFFRKVNSRGGLTFLQLVGNVAELVCESPDALDQMADRRNAEAVARLAKSLTTPGRAGASRLAAIGGSAFSAPELDPTRPYPITNATEPFADVGFRLAFTAPAHNAAERLRWLLEEQPYLTQSLTPTTHPATGPTTTEALPSTAPAAAAERPVPQKTVPAASH